MYIQQQQLERVEILFLSGQYFKSKSEAQPYAENQQQKSCELNEHGNVVAITFKKPLQVYKSCVRYDQNLTVCEILGDLSCLVATNDTVPCGGYWYEDDVYDETPMSEVST